MAKNNAENRFFNFLNFFAIFFGISLPGSRMSRIWDYNFFFPFLSLSNLILPRNNARKRFFLFFEFFCYFFRNFLARVKCERNLRLKFFSLFLGLYHPACLKIMPERVFFNFLLFFSEFSCLGRVWTEFWTKFFFSLSAYIILF